MPDSPRILIVAQTDWFFHLHFLPLGRELVRQGWQVHLACLVEDHQERLEALGIHVIPLQHFTVRSLGMLQQGPATAELAGIIRRVKPNILQLISPKPITLGSLAAKATGTHGVVSLMTGLGFLFTGENPRLQIIRRLTLGAIKAGHAPAAARIIFQNSTDRRFYIKSKIIPPQKAVIIPGVGTDLNRFQPGPKQNSEPVIVLGARMLRDKGVVELVDASRLLHERGVPCTIVFCGQPDPGNPSSLSETDLKRWHDAGLIEWRGQVDAIESVLARADIACLPSYREGMPKFLMDAAAAGLPLVATDVPGCREIVRHGHNGLLVPPRNPAALAEALTLLVRDAAKRERYGLASRRLAEREFSQDRGVELTLDVYRAVLRQLDKEARGRSSKKPRALG